MNRGADEKDLLIYEYKTLLHTRLCDFVSAKVQSKRTGKNSEFFRFDFTDWVNVVALTKEKHIVIIKQFRFGTERIEIEIPGGAIEKGEDPCPNPAIQNNWCYTVLIEGVTKVAEQNMDEMEDIEVNLISLEEMDSLIKNGSISHGLVLNAMMMFANNS